MAAKYITRRLLKYSDETVRAMMSEVVNRLLDEHHDEQDPDITDCIENVLDMVACGDYIVHDGKVLSVTLDAWKLTDQRYRS
jgi:hypothetical protein